MSTRPTGKVLRRRPRRARAVLAALVTGSVGLAVSAVLAARPAVAHATRAAVAASFASPGPAAPTGTDLAPPAGSHVVIASPEPGSLTASPTTQISLLGVRPSAIGAVTVTGSRSGPHPGRMRAYSTGDGASFLPDRPFVAGETVTVQTHVAIAGAPSGTFSFTVARDLPLRMKSTRPPLRTDVPGVDHFATAPGLDPPHVTVSRDSGGNGDFFLAPKGTTGHAGPMIVRADGTLVWFDPLPHSEAFDLNVQRYHGAPVLTWFQGEVIDGHGQGVDIIANTSYKTVAVVRAGNGYRADLHDFQLTARGTALVTAFQATRWNTSSMGGPTDGTALDGIVQEIDVPTGLVMYQWDSLDHVPVADSLFGAPKGAGPTYDYFHINSIDALPNGDLIVSARNTSAAYLVDPAEAGDVLWQLGGRHSSFTMGPGSQFWFQHDVREVAPNELTIFDDAAAPAREPESRAILVRLDLVHHSATLVRADLPPTPRLATALGNVQTVGSGSLVVGWGTTPYYSQYSASGALLYDASLPAGDDSYRAYRYAWHATPTTKPAVVVSSAAPGAVVHVSWNGATDVARWQVLGGTSASSLLPEASASHTTFETAIPVARASGFVAVEALDAAGKVIGRSPTVRA
ncbi:MAG TPA: arylsulfotransferase family protein [Acidimicrobiales bacterium]|nr:arylsulfotransferase family protein [Acidimicrobiales bacterium]